MKKNLLSVITCFPALVFAQTSITQSDIIIPNTTVYIATDSSTTGLNAGTTGSGQTWDFTSLNSGDVDTIYFYDAANTPYATDFPASNVAQERVTNGVSNYTYFTANASLADISGNVMASPLDPSIPISVPYQDPELIMNFPATMGQSFADTVYYQFSKSGTDVGGGGFIDSVYVSHYAIRHVSFDAEGTMNTPLGSFPSVRIQNNEVDYDTVLIKLFGAWQPYQEGMSTRKMFTWYSPNQNVAIAEATVDTTTGTDSISTVVWKYDPILKAKQLTAAKTTKLFPNPASDKIFITLDETAAASVEVYDLNGKLLKTTMVNNSSLLTMELSRFAEGIYFYQVKDSNGAGIERGKFTVVR